MKGFIGIYFCQFVRIRIIMNFDRKSIIPWNSNCAGTSITCSPILTLEDACKCLKNPPTWVNYIIELIPRSNLAVQCKNLKCHVENEEFGPLVRLQDGSIPRTLVCHDMKGGYTDDKFVSPVYQGNSYSFYRWAQIDVFVYFSHHLITIPPLNWINVAHKNGVKILGTFITEWNFGKIVCDKILESSESVKKIANILVEVCILYKIDGWLINIENVIDNPANLIEFVEYLTKSIHVRRPGSSIIWYDSVTNEGKLSWQNELNSLNKCYFDVCDGIFLNYAWKEINLANTVKAAQHRNLDVYVGVDVFGRNCYGGGHFNTYKAAEKIRQHNLSMALFAQAWTHETLPETPKETFMKRFLLRDNAFWKILWPYLYTHFPKWPFHSTFFSGADDSCLRLISQEVQLTQFLYNDTFLEEIDKEVISPCSCLQLNFDGKYASCIITKSHLDKNKNYVHRLITCDIYINNGFLMYIYTKKINNDNNFSLIILLQLTSGSYKKVVCHSVKQEKLLDTQTITDLNTIESLDLATKVSKINRYPKEWNLHFFQVNLNDCKILEVGITIEQGEEVCVCGLEISEIL